MQDIERKKEVIIVFHNHVDPEWARCFEDIAYNNSFITRSYIDVFEWMVDEFIRLSNQGFHFSEGQVVFWEKYLERNPEKREILSQLVKEGKLEILMQGFLVCDTNYVPAEGIMRNYLCAIPFYKEYGEGFQVDQAFVWDAFGSSANLPQILKLFGALRVGGTKYRTCLDDYWVGIDGSKLPCIDKKFGSCNIKGGPILYVCARHPHCPECNGYGCKACNGRGMINKHPFRKEEVIAVLENCANMHEVKKFVLIGGEEVLPDDCIIEAINECRDKYQGEIEFRFGTLREYGETFQSDYEAMSAYYDEPGKELNPVNQGGYLTRIENKQKVRKATYALLQAEAAYAGKLWENGGKLNASEEMKQAWKYLLMNMHHDSISGAHIDSGQRELMGWLEKCEEITTEFYSKKWHEISHGRKKLISKEAIHHKKLGRMEITYDRKGIVSALKNGLDLFGAYMHEITAPRSGLEQVHIGELIIQDDIGDLYGTYLFGEYICLGKFNYCIMEEEDAIIWRGSRTVLDINAPKLEWEVMVRASEDGERLDYTINLDTEMVNKRISVLIPVNESVSGKSVWEIPFGFIERKYLTPEEAQNEIEVYNVPSQYERTAILPTGDYPTLHWVRHDITDKTGVAVLNKGLPCNRWIPGCFMLGLIRTPQVQGVTVMPHADEMWDIAGAKSRGRHIFEFSVYPYDGVLRNSALTKLGYWYNDAELPLPFLIEGNAVVTAFKVAEDEKGFILRVFETEGRDSNIKITFKENKKTVAVMANEVDVLGEIKEGKVFSYMLHKHEILTLRIS